MNLRNNWWLWNYIGGKESLNQLQLGLTPNQIENYITTFKDIYDNSWYDSIPENNREIILNKWFNFNCGIYSIIRIIRLGECVHYLRDKKGFNDESIIRLRDKDQFKSVSIELEYTSCFAQAGMELEMHPQLYSGKKAEGNLIINGKSIYYEIISQNTINYEKEERNYFFEIDDCLKENFESITAKIKFKSRDMYPQTKLAKLYKILNQHRPPFNYNDKDLEIHLMESEGISLTVEGAILNRRKILENWISRVYNKYKQLPSDSGGVIIANSSSLWNPKDIELIHETSWRKTKNGHKSRISGIIFSVRQLYGVPSISGGRLSFISPIIRINRYSKFDYSKEIRKMAEVISRFPDWIKF